MNEKASLPVLNSRSVNRKSKTCTELSRSIRNPKWVGLIAIVIAFVGLAGVAEAQQPKKLPTIGYLSTRDPASESERAEAVRLGLRERGHGVGFVVRQSKI